MNKTSKALVAGIIALGLVGGLTACTESTTAQKQYSKLDKASDKRVAPESSDTEYNNYMKAQKAYADPNTILWCTGSFQAASSPLFTVPIAGKLTSSSVSFYPGQRLNTFNGGQSGVLEESRSVDGMYHGNPSPYRYGFTPGGAYVEMANLAVLCTTQLTKFQQQTLDIKVTQEQANAATKTAEEKLKAGDTKGAQKELDNLTGGF